MVSTPPLWFSRQLLSSLNTEVTLYHSERIPYHDPVVVVSNHRSFMDAALLMVALGRPIRFACHRYMGQVPVLRDVVQQMGGFTLNSHSLNRQSLFDQASDILASGETVGIFPEGAQPMVKPTSPGTMGSFQRGFAHLLLRSPCPTLTVLPVAIAPCEESSHSAFPLRLLHWFDPSEPLFDQAGWHPMVIYHRVNVLVGHPLSIDQKQRDAYQGRRAKDVVHHITRHCETEVQRLLSESMGRQGPNSNLDEPDASGSDAHCLRPGFL